MNLCFSFTDVEHGSISMGDVERLQANSAEAQRDAGINGFVNRYATTSPTEDQAEVYALLAVDREEACADVSRATASFAARPPRSAK